MGLSILIFISSLSWGSPKQIEIDSKVLYQGTKIASPRIFAKEGKTSKVVMNDSSQKREYSLEVNPREVGLNNVSMTYSLSIRRNKEELLSHGSILIPNNQSGIISLDKGRIKVFLRVKPS